MPAHSSAAGSDLHEAKRIKAPVRAASTATVTLATPGAALDGVTLSSGDRVLLKDQGTPSQNGIYVWTGSASTLTRATDADAAADLVYGFLTYVREGTLNAASYWVFTQSAAITVESTSLTFVRVAQNPATAEFGAVDFSATGLTGATSASRYVGATATGSPSTGTFVIGDFVIDRTGKIWICTVAGSPGTWVQTGSAITGNETVGGSVTVGGSTSVVNGQSIAFQALTELTTIAAAATTTTTIQIPAGAIVFAVNVRVTVVIPTAATFTVIGNTTTTVFQTAAVSTAVDSTDRGTAAGAFYNATAQTIRITPNATPAANTGRVRVTIFYLVSTPPTS